MGNGHINDTYRVTFENEQGVKKHYILQQMNKENTVSYDLIDNPEILYEGGLAFGRFQSMLADYPAKTLHETIPGFHDTRERFETFKKAVEEDV